MNVRFMKQWEIWGDWALDVIKSYGTAAGATDLAIALGAYMGHGTKTSDGLRSCAYWSASYKDHFVQIVDWDGRRNIKRVHLRKVAARPVLGSPGISAICHGAAGAMPEYGTYPQTIASDAIAQKLETEYNSWCLYTTGNQYTFDEAGNYPEYIMDGRRYIRVVAMSCDCDSILSNGRRLNNGDVCWIEVLPIKWLAGRYGNWVAHQALFAGIKFDDRDSHDGNFSRTAMKKYLDDYFAPQMLQSLESAFKKTR